MVKTAPSLDRRTRDRVARLLLESGPATAAALGQRLGLSPAAVRRHLDAMVADGTLVARAPRPALARGRGRPARLFALSDQGHAALHNTYGDIAAAALRFIAQSAGEAGLDRFARARVAGLERRFAGRLAGRSLPERSRALADALTEEGYAASIQAVAPGTGIQICQHHCPVQQVAAEFPQLCDAETQAFSRLLGTHVQRLATIAHGDGVCTTHVPLTTAEGPRP